jgi:phosphohistidine phosphatase
LQAQWITEMETSIIKRLYVVRHADAVPGSNDTTRPLSKKGRKQSEVVGSFLNRADISVDAIWQSELLRAQQTAQIIAKALRSGGVPVTTAGLNPDDSVSALQRRISAFKGDLMVVGHAPSLPCLISSILGLPQQHLIVDLKKGGVACLERDESGRWTMLWCIEPGICR